MFKRGMKGVYQHCAEKHLHRYLAEFDFRYNNRAALGVNDDEPRRTLAEGIKGKRLTYRRPNEARFQASGARFLAGARKRIAATAKGAKAKRWTLTPREVRYHLDHQIRNPVHYR